jgi:mevalonate kinase
MPGTETPKTASEQHGCSRAFGKVILFGEHAVVYGVQAIAAGISRGVRAESHRAEANRVSVNDQLLPADHELRHALREMLTQLGLGPASLTLHSELPQGAGLGSSAAMAVATARALAQSHNRELSERQVFDAAQVWERVFHGNPSGVDVAAAQSNSIIGYVRGNHPEPLSLLRPMYLVVVQAGPPASTKLMVDMVARSRERNPVQFERTLSAIESLAKNATLLLRQGDLVSVGKLMDLNQMLLAGWMLSTQEIELACQIARDEGALGAKLTGAGGGGCVLVLAENPEMQKQIVHAFEARSLRAFAATVGES